MGAAFRDIWRLAFNAASACRWLLWAVLAACFVLLGLTWNAVHQEISANLGDRAFVQSVTVAASAGDVVLGHDRLGLRNEGRDSPEASHLMLRNLKHGAGDTDAILWLGRNIAQERRVLFKYKEFGELFLRRWEVRDKDRLLIDGQQFEFGFQEADNPGDFPEFRVTALTQHGKELRSFKIGPVEHRLAGVMEKNYSQGALDKLWVDECHPGGARPAHELTFASLRSSFERDIAYRHRNLDDNPFFKKINSNLRGMEWPVISIGGEADCLHQIAVPGTGPAALQIVLRDGFLFLKPGRHGDSTIGFRRASEQQWQTFNDIERPLHGHVEDCEGSGPDYCIAGQSFGPLEWIILGRTRYEVGLGEDGQSLVLSPKSNNHLYHRITADEAKRMGLREADLSTLDEKIGDAPQSISIEKRWLEPSDASPTLPIAAIPDFADTLWREINTSGWWSIWRNPVFWLFLIPAPIILCLLLRPLQVASILLFHAHRTQEAVREESIGLKPCMTLRKIIQSAMIFTSIYLLFFLIGGEMPNGDLLSRNAQHYLLLYLWAVATTVVVAQPFLDRADALIHEAGGVRLAQGTIWLVFSILMILGVLTLELLALGASNTRMVKFDQKHIQSVAIALVAAQIVCLISVRNFAWTVSLLIRDQRGGSISVRIPVAILFAAIVAVLFLFQTQGDASQNAFLLAALIFVGTAAVSILLLSYPARLFRMGAFVGLLLSYTLWLFVGSEEGLLGIQPVEVGKLWCIVLIAYLFTNIDHNRYFEKFYVKNSLLSQNETKNREQSEHEKNISIILIGILISAYILIDYRYFSEDIDSIIIKIVISISILIFIYFFGLTIKSYLMSLFILSASWILAYHAVDIPISVFYIFIPTLTIILTIPYLAIWRLQSFYVFLIVLCLNIGVFSVFPVLQNDFSPVLIIGITAAGTLCMICASFMAGNLQSVLRWGTEWHAPPGIPRWHLGSIIARPGSGRPTRHGWYMVLLLGASGIVLLFLGAVESDVRLLLFGASLFGVALVQTVFGLWRIWFEAATLIVFLLALLPFVSLGGTSYIDAVDTQIKESTTFDLSTVETRIAVWKYPDLFPDAGYQLYESRRLIEKAHGDDWTAVSRRLPWGGPEIWGEKLYCGAYRLFGVDKASCEAAAEPQTLSPDDRFRPYSARLQRLPAVQDDFIMTFFINRFGVGMAAGVAVLQVVLIALMMYLVLSRCVGIRGNYRYDTLRQFLRFSVMGGGVLLSLHWMISWGNVTGLIPIMGQPMTWFSAANSHNLFMALPILALTLLLARLIPRG